jgi:hypothetical protein
LKLIIWITGYDIQEYFWPCSFFTKGISAQNLNGKIRKSGDGNSWLDLRSQVSKNKHPSPRLSVIFPQNWEQNELKISEQEETLHLIQNLPNQHRKYQGKRIMNITINV